MRISKQKHFALQCLSVFVVPRSSEDVRCPALQCECFKRPSFKTHKIRVLIYAPCRQCVWGWSPGIEGHWLQFLKMMLTPAPQPSWDLMGPGPSKHGAQSDYVGCIALSPDVGWRRLSRSTIMWPSAIIWSGTSLLNGLIRDNYAV